MTRRPAISLTGVAHEYRIGGQRILAVADVDVDVSGSELTAITGPSGSGKSTMLNIMGALMRPTHGNVQVEGTEIQDLDTRALRAVRAARIGFIHQRFHLVPHLTASQNVMVALRYTSMPVDERRDRVSASLAAVRLDRRSGHRPSELSGGEQQRVAIARALVTSPAIIIADEPTGNLDSVTGASILDLLREATHGAAVVVATHDRAVVEVADRHLRLHDGQLSS